MRKSINYITEFIFLESKLQKADLIIVAGSRGEKVPHKVIEIYQKRLADKIIYTGGFNEKLSGYESEIMSNLAIKNGIPESSVFLDKKSLNTKENALESLKIIKRNKLKHSKIILVGLAYHTRRLYMTFSKIFPKSQLMVVSPQGDKISKLNWWKSEYGREKVMTEVEKIGKYYLKGDLEIL